MAQQASEGPIIAGPDSPAISAVGTSLVVREWTDSGPSYLHIHRSDDEAWHVLEGSLRFIFRIGRLKPQQAPQSSCLPACHTLIG